MIGARILTTRPGTSAAAKIVGIEPGVIGDHVADLGDPAPHRNAERPEQAFRDAPDGDPRRGLARARALEDVPHVAVVVLEDSGQVGVSRTGTGHGDLRVLVFGTRRHLLRPVLPVAVLDDERDRRPEGLAEPHAGAELGRVLLDLHAAAASVAHHAAPHVDVHRVDVDGEPRRAAFDDRREARAMGFTGGEKA
jgi:hypothetical protein